MSVGPPWLPPYVDFLALYTTLVLITLKVMLSSMKKGRLNSFLAAMGVSVAQQTQLRQHSLKILRMPALHNTINSHISSVQYLVN